jgi:hypothetical protein
MTTLPLAFYSKAPAVGIADPICFGFPSITGLFAAKLTRFLAECLETQQRPDTL